MRAGETESEEAVVEWVREEISETMGARAMTIAEQLRQKGIQIGKQEGIQIGEERGIQIGEQRGRQEERQQMQQQVRQALSSLLRRKFGELPKSYQAQMEQADATELLRWNERILDARTLEEVFQS